MKNIAKIIAWVLIVLLLAGGVAAIWLLTDGGKEDFRSFVLSYDGKMIVQSKSRMEFEVGSSHRFDVKYIFDAPDEEEHDYTVSIVPNTKNDFEYTVNDKLMYWQDEDEISNFFRLEQSDTYFTFEIPQKVSASDVLKWRYPLQTVKISSEPDESKPLYLLVVSSYDESVTYEIGLFFIENKGEAHTISCVAEYFDGETADIKFVCQETAFAGETVYFTADVWYSSMESVSAVYLRTASAEDEYLAPIYGSVYTHDYSFVMPDEDVIIYVLVYSVMRG